MPDYIPAELTAATLPCGSAGYQTLIGVCVCISMATHTHTRVCVLKVQEGKCIETGNKESEGRGRSASKAVEWINESGRACKKPLPVSLMAH